ncbi:exodeoxyribonuclease V subunit alpha [Tessaracoccus antarcticus]|uniref:RecBCD enzyme subunit RecD n=1 Tax=Tessaracoccus antarcticus TaxID=2479848 RepID=A0A3M0GNN0_9ACTN|nr:exodeoxyribonuclease V subunit alpha [Tessaracoccus antarcticus]RMB58896.1 exodeoxyribonuclease V subunit alpha [Tessaracoccus antarcticus]
MSRHEVPVAATGLLRRFAEATLIAPVDFHLARRMAALCRETDPRVELAFALTTRELRLGSVCLDLSRATDLAPEAGIEDGVAEGLDLDLPWPELEGWLGAVASSPAVADEDGESRPFRLVGTWLYLDRYWAEERSVEASLHRRSDLQLPPIDDAHLVRAATPLMSRLPDALQDAAVSAALRNATTVITGGPGTGKTTTVARILGGLADEDNPPLVALAAPTGKASTRLASAVAESLPQGQGGLRLRSYTLHKLLGVVPGRAQRIHGSHNLLPHDVVIVDETSMVSLTMMSWLLEAVSGRTRLILIGDPQQLASVEAGAVLADIAASPGLITSHPVDGSGAADAVVELRSNFRSNEEITRLATAIQRGDANAVVGLLTAGESCTLQDYTGREPITDYDVLLTDLHATAAAVRAAALEGDGGAANAALGRHRILCAHREGPFGVGHWARTARGWLSEQFEGYGLGAGAWPGQPLLITRNSDTAANGDTAVVVKRGDRLLAAVDRAQGTLLVDPVLLDDATDLHAMTIHKSQGSQFDAVSVILPPVGSPLLTRELLYTAITRARTHVRLYGGEEALRVAVTTPARRASGLGRRRA